MNGSLLQALRGSISYANVLATAAIFVTLGGGAYAVSGLAGTNAVIYACVKKRGGTVRAVSRSKRCKKSERKVVWNVRGATGPKGETGSSGPGGSQGAAGAVGPVGSGGPVGATGPTGPSAGTAANLPLLVDNFGSFGSPTWTNQPAALTELFGTTNTRLKADLTGATQVRLVCNVIQAGAAAAAIRVQYSTDQSSWNYLDGATGPSVSVSTAGLKVSSWVAPAAGAKADVFIRAVGIGGDASADPTFSNVLLQVK